MFFGLRSVIYPTANLDASKAWYAKTLGIEPYFDEGPYVGFDLGGYELGLFGAGDPADGPRTYWGVANVDDALAHLLASGATLDEPVADVGGGIRMAAVRDPEGFAFGIIEHPTFAAKPVDSPGPGR